MRVTAFGVPSPMTAPPLRRADRHPVSRRTYSVFEQGLERREALAPECLLRRGRFGVWQVVVLDGDLALRIGGRQERDVDSCAVVGVEARRSARLRRSLMQDDAG